MLDLFLEYLQVSKLRIMMEFLNQLWSLFGSPLGCYIAQEHSLGLAILVRFIWEKFFPFLDNLGASLTALSFGVAPKDPMAQDYHPVFVEYTIRHWGLVPIIHVDLVVPSLEKRYGGGERYGLYAFMEVPYGSIGNVVFPTSLEYNDIKDLPAQAGKYSLLWNCYVVLVHALWERLPEAGLGLAIPTIYSFGAAGVISVGAMAATSLWGLSAMLPSLFTAGPTMSATASIAGDMLTDLWSRLSAPKGVSVMAFIDWARALSVHMV
jgi:hypothetical protein